MFAEQAIYTSLKTGRQEGYQLAAVSPGIDGELARELEPWGPAHDALLEPGQGASSLNFHPLAGGLFCVSRTLAAGEEYSGRGGPRVYSQMLILSRETLLRFANNPFAVIEAASASGQMPVYDHPPAALEPVRLLGRASPVNQLRLAELLTDPGVEVLASLLSALVEASAVAVRSVGPLERLLSGMFSLLPVTMRLDFSFSTGLRYTQRRPVRVMALPIDTPEQRALERATGARPCDFTRSELPPTSELRSGWAQLVRDVLSLGQLRLLPKLLCLAESHIDGATSLDDIARLVEAKLPAAVH